MKRLTERKENGVINVRYATEHETAIHRLAAIEDILGDEYGLDAVARVVRCKNCRYYQSAKVNKKGFLICPASGMEITENDFCSYGEPLEMR